jgi:hypothetical protein
MLYEIDADFLVDESISSLSSMTTYEDEYVCVCASCVGDCSSTKGRYLLSAACHHNFG